MGFTEILIILAIALVLFGPEDLPVIANKLGKIVYQIRKVSNEFSKEFRNTVDLPGTVLNKAFEQNMLSDDRREKNKGAGEPGHREPDGRKGKTGNRGNNSDLEDNLIEDDLLTEEILLRYEDEKPEQEANTAKKGPFPDPLKELPPDMLFYEEKETSR